MKLTRRADNRLGERWSILDRFDILTPDKSQVYLRRWRILQTPWFGAYLHRIFLPDADDAPHDHPWSFISVVLRGGYIERFWADPTLIPDEPGTEMISTLRSWSRFSTHRVSRRQAHQIKLVHSGTVTLVLVGARRQEWGFYTDTGFVPWRRYTGTDSEAAS